MKDVFYGFLAGILFCGILYVFHSAIFAFLKVELAKLHNRLDKLESKFVPSVTYTTSTGGTSTVTVPTEPKP